VRHRARRKDASDRRPRRLGIEAGQAGRIEAKFGFVEKLEDSGHIAFSNEKIERMTRLAQFARANPKEIGKVIARPSVG
jgi:hypothetical protein